MAEPVRVTDTPPEATDRPDIVLELRGVDLRVIPVISAYALLRAGRMADSDPSAADVVEQFLSIIHPQDRARAEQVLAEGEPVITWQEVNQITRTLIEAMSATPDGDSPLDTATTEDPAPPGT